jgi:hypothetical protein
MINEMSRVNETSRAHMQRDMGTAGQWTCDCSECHEVRSLIGIEKVLQVWAAVRELDAAEVQLSRIPDGSEKQGVWAHYLTLLDQLAAKVAG